MYTDFIDKSNQRAKQMQRANELAKQAEAEQEKRYEGLKCESKDCLKMLTHAQKEYSKSKFGKQLCWHHQDEERVSGK